MFPILPTSLRELTQRYDLCVTGEGLSHLQALDRQQLLRLIPHIQVFARVVPKQKVRDVDKTQILLVCPWGSSGGRQEQCLMLKLLSANKQNLSRYPSQLAARNRAQDVCCHYPEGTGSFSSAFLKLIRVNLLERGLEGTEFPPHSNAQPRRIVQLSCSANSHHAVLFGRSL